MLTVATPGRTLCHPKTMHGRPRRRSAGRPAAVPTPCSATADLVALDAATCQWSAWSCVRWAANTPRWFNHVGRAYLAGCCINDVLIVPMENQGESFLPRRRLRATGRNRWRRPNATPDNNYATPVLARPRRPGLNSLMVAGTRPRTAFDPLTGMKSWEYVPEEGKMSPIPSPVRWAGDDLILAPRLPAAA